MLGESKVKSTADNEKTDNTDGKERTDPRAEFEHECVLLRQHGLKTNPLRQEYEREVSALRKLPQVLASEGRGEKEIARIMHAERRRLGRVYKQAAPPLFREYIYAATAAKYGDPLGPDFDMLCRRKTYAEIIESASRPIENLDDRLTVEGFRKWFSETYE